ncbi:NAD(P)H-binding protein [Lentzea sp. NPDC051838]|uniref:NAD(P)-dependent oxidoreductase n=1 Tax=Lentzea sp. NPDC051838 TaxID=3154849 RepID=UPI0034463133
MTKIVVFGASGRAGKQIAAVAEARGHEVLRVGRNPGVHKAAEVAEGYDVAVSAVADLSRDAADFYTEAARALVASGVGRIIVVGVFPLLEASPGVRMIDLPDFPEENRAFMEGHAAGVEVLAGSDADWLVISPVGMFGGTSSGKYRIGGLDPSDELTYEDFALAVVDEIERPTCRLTQIGVASAG